MKFFCFCVFGILTIVLISMINSLTLMLLMVDEKTRAHNGILADHQGQVENGWEVLSWVRNFLGILNQRGWFQSSRRVVEKIINR